VCTVVGTSQGEVKFNSGNQALALADIELCLSEGIRQFVSQQKVLVNTIFQSSAATYWKCI